MVSDLTTLQKSVLGVLRGGGFIQLDARGRYRLYSDGFCWVRSLYRRTVSALEYRGLIVVTFDSDALTIWAAAPEAPVAYNMGANLLKPPQISSNRGGFWS